MEISGTTPTIFLKTGSGYFESEELRSLHCTGRPEITTGEPVKTLSEGRFYRIATTLFDESLIAIGQLSYLDPQV
jgi:hypothetical protein